MTTLHIEYDKVKRCRNIPIKFWNKTLISNGTFKFTIAEDF